MKQSYKKVMLTIVMLCCLSQITGPSNLSWAIEYKGEEIAVPYNMLNKSNNGTNLTQPNLPKVRDEDIILNNIDLKLALLFCP